MEVAVPQVSRVANVEVGKLFVLVGAGRQSAVCLRAAYELSPEEEDEANRVIPLWWPSDPSSVNVAIYARSIPGDAVVLDGARIEVNPLSAVAGGIGSLSNVYARDGRLYIPHAYNGRFSGLVDVETGIILPSVSGSYIGFSEWRITVPWETTDRRVILPQPADNLDD